MAKLYVYAILFENHQILQVGTVARELSQAHKPSTIGLVNCNVFPSNQVEKPSLLFTASLEISLVRKLLCFVLFVSLVAFWQNKRPGCSVSVCFIKGSRLSQLGLQFIYLSEPQKDWLYMLDGMVNFVTDGWLQLFLCLLLEYFSIRSIFWGIGS